MVGFFIVDFGLAQVNTWVKIKTVINALLRAGFNVGDVVQIRRVMEKIQLQYIWVYFFYFWCCMLTVGLQ